MTTLAEGFQSHDDVVELVLKPQPLPIPPDTDGVAISARDGQLEDALGLVADLRDWTPGAWKGSWIAATRRIMSAWPRRRWPWRRRSGRLCIGPCVTSYARGGAATSWRPFEPRP